ncbi:hypothetical protein [Actinomadura sp. DC4]|uniref:hypothetical protein n=1 Tax=Actinomadura sp. DC4 TaxID=3055069 RepID=UPI0025AEFFDD|nr:hypothetical protein [Actinomadura sp. DC4]MDN3354034.1 hypothetical protein [Actinomadura sp. DC4]
MRLKKASLAFTGAAAAVAITTMAASPAWACSDRDPALKLRAFCGKEGPAWMLSNPNGWGAVPATWMDNQGGHSNGKISVPARGSVALPTHATKVIVTAYRPDKGRELPVWQRHGAVGALLSCKATKPSAPPTKAKPKPSAKPTETSEAPKPVTPPSGEARPATPVKAQPAFTG